MHQFRYILYAFTQRCEAAVHCGVVKLHSNDLRVATESSFISVLSRGEDDKETINESLLNLHSVSRAM